MSKTNLIIHHSGNPSRKPQFEQIDDYHASRDFPLSSLGHYVGYQFVIEPVTGELRQARSIEERGAHTNAACAEGHCNLVGIGVCVAGDLTKDRPDDAQLSTLYELYKRLGWPRIVLHSDVKVTSCPGSFDFRNEMTRRWLLDLAGRLRRILEAIPRFVGTIRGRLLQREADRIREILDQP